MFAIEVQTVFPASHALRLPGGGIEPDHSHDFHLTVRLECAELDALETVLDFHKVERMLAEIINPWRGRLLNEIEPFVWRVNPSAERIAEEVGRELHRVMKEEADMATAMGERGLRLVEVRLTEAVGCLAIWLP